MQMAIKGQKKQNKLLKIQGKKTKDAKLPPLAPTQQITKVKFSDDVEPLPETIFQQPPVFDNRRKQSQEHFFFDQRSNSSPMLLNPNFSTPDRVVVGVAPPIEEEEEPLNMFNIPRSPEVSVVEQKLEVKSI